MRRVLSAFEIFEWDLIRPFASIWHSQETAGIYEKLMTFPGADIQDFIVDCRYLNYYAISRCAVSCLRLKFPNGISLGPLPLYGILRKQRGFTRT